MTTLYRTKAEPLKPHQIKFPFRDITATAGYVLSPAQCLATGEYRDISPTPEAGYQLGTVATWDEVNGTVTMDVVEIPATSLSDVKAAALAEVKQRRDGVLRSYSEKLVIYQPNYDAALAINQGTADTLIMPNGATATAFATATAAKMNLTPQQWSAYILGEWQTLGTGVTAMENEYLCLTYHSLEGINDMTTIAQVETALAGFRAMTGG